MAVSFKVPASPKKDIFNINTFLGVDLTNSGADMDEVRSPNAENMVRYVPGKVRKRAGYRKDILFCNGSGENVNFAVGTSADEQEVTLTAEDDRVKLYTMVRDDFLEGTYYIEYDYKSEVEFRIVALTTTGGTEFPIAYGQIHEPTDDWVHCIETLEIITHDISIKNIAVQELNLGYDESASFYIKNFAFMVEKDSNYKWSPAPSNFVYSTYGEDNAIYGCHIAKAGTFEGDRVLNVNRALDTHSYEETFSVTTSKTKIKDIAEHLPIGATIYIEFDYIMENGANSIDVYVQSHELSHACYGTGEWIHYSEELYINYGDGPEKIEMKGYNGSSSIQIKNLSIMYEKDENYTWSSAPEDRGEKFHIEDVYNYGTHNYAAIESATMSSDAASGQCLQNIVISDEPMRLMMVNITFNLSTNSIDDLDSVRIRIKTSNSTLWEKTYTENLKNEKIDVHLYCSETGWINSIEAFYALENGSASGKCETTLTDIKIYKAEVKKSFYISPIWYVYHVGSSFYLRAHNSKDIIKCYEGANTHVSRSWQLNKRLYIIDGKDIYVHEIGKGTIEPIGKDNAYIPLLTIGKEPDGGGTSYDPLNMLQPGFYETFQGHSGKTQFQLTFGGLDATECKAWVLNSSGTWVLKKEDSDFTVNRSLGKITFTTAPGESPVTGEDNVKILAYRTVKEYRERVTKCTHGTLYGVGGAGDRLFLAGNPDHPNWDFYSQQYDPTYFPDTNYATLGSEQSLITGYAIVNNYLATFKDGFDQSQVVFVREGDLLKTGGDSGDEEQKEAETTEAVFKLINTLQGEGVIAPYTFGYIQTEPLFLSKHGIYAITEQDITGEKYTQSRSFYLDGKLRKEPNPENAMSCIYDNQYILSLNNHLYILDGLQATRTDKSEPYATRQYAGFYCTNVPAMCIWQDNGVWFGTNDGRVCAFNTDIESLNSYNDDGEPIYACWETPDLDGRLFYKNKTFRYFAVRLMQAIKTTATLYSRKLGVWNLIKEETVIGNPIDFENFDFDLFSFSQDTTEKVIHTKVRVKKVDKARFKVENDKYNEPFGLFDLALEYIESGNYKG